jgi:hypothetical protein
MIARRRVALIGVAAILFQAFLFGWHHHALALPQSSGPFASVQSATQPLAPATAEELCEICAVLHQQSAGTLAFVTPPVPCCTGVAIHRSEADPIGRTDARIFQARAPPAIESTT